MRLDIDWEAVKRLPAAERAEFERELADLDRLFEENPLQRFEPHPKQVTFLGSRDRIKAFLGGNRSGKTTAGIVDDLIQAVDEDCLPERLRPFKRWQPPFRCRIVAPDFIETMDGVIFHKLREWVPRGQLVGGSWEKAYDKTKRKLRFKNGSEFSFMTFEQDLDKFGGTDLHRVHYDEEPPENIRKECRRGLMDHGGDELFTMTPLHGMTWMFDKVYERRYESGVGVVEVSTDDNPHISPEEIAAFMAELTPEEQEARRHGRFVHFGGLVLGMFDDSLHVVDEIRPEHLRGLDVLVGIDPGVVRGGVVWVAFDRDNHALVFDELYPRNQNLGPKEDPSTISAQILEKNAYWGLVGDREPQYVIDPSARNRYQGSGESAENVEGDLSREGIYCSWGNNNRRFGVFQLRRRLVAQPHPALTVTRNCANWLWERMRWRIAADEESEQERPKGSRSGDSFKTQGPDHLMDPTRYVCAERVWGPWIEEPGEKSNTWVPGTAPRQSWFTGARDAPPMGSMS